MVGPPCPPKAPRSGVIPSQSADWRGNPSPSPPLCKRRCQNRSVAGGIVKSGRGRTPPLRTSTESPCVLALSFRASAHTGVGIRLPLPPLCKGRQRAALTEGLSKGIFRAPARGTFALGGKSTQKRRSNLRFENPFARLHPPRILTAFATRTLCYANFA